MQDIDLSHLKINDKQLLFLQYHLRGLSITDAAIAAGYAKKHAVKQGSRIINSKYVKKYIKDLNRDINKAVMEHVEKNVEERQKVIKKSLKIHELEQKIVVNFAWKINELQKIVEDPSTNPNDKIKAIEVLNKMQGDNAPERNINDTTTTIIDDRTQSVCDMTKDYFDAYCKQARQVS